MTALARSTSTALAIPEMLLTEAERLPDLPQWRNRFLIRSAHSDRKYVIAQNTTTGQWGCSCPGYRRALKDPKTGKSYRKCTHLLDGCQLSLSQIHGNALPDLRPKHKKLEK